MGTLYDTGTLGPDGTSIQVTRTMLVNTAGAALGTVGAGSVEATTSRMTLASDDPAVVQLIDIETALDAIKTAVELLDNAVTGSLLAVQQAALVSTVDQVAIGGRTSGGLTIFNSIDLDESEEEIKGTAGTVYSISAFNRTAAPLYLRFYNATAANTTVGTTAALAGPFVVPANADSDGAGFIWNNEIGIAFSTAISAAVTTGVAANDTGAPGANDCVVVVGYV